MIKDILAFADDSLVSNERFALPAHLARQQGARLSAVHILADTYAYVPMEIGPAAGEILQAQVEAEKRAAAKVGKQFREQCKSFGLDGSWFVANDWSAAVNLAGRFDLVVVGQSASGLPTLLSSIRPEDLVLGVGRPAIVVPKAGTFESCGKRVIIAWKATKEAGRAVHDALSLLTETSVVTIVEVADCDPAEAARRSGSEELRAHLSRHGIKATVDTVKGPDSVVCDVLLSKAKAVDADLVVMGAYGHSRFRELVLGGVTRGMLRDMSVPLFLSH